MPGDDQNDSSSGTFDDWLDEEPGPDTDPYSELSDDNPEEEIADWMAFSQGDGDVAAEEDPGDGVDAPQAGTDQSAAEGTDDDTGEIPTTPNFADGDETGEIDIVAPATTVDAFEFDGGGRPDTEEIPIVAGADVVSASVTNEPVFDTGEDEATLDDPDEVVEMEAVVAAVDGEPESNDGVEAEDDAEATAFEDDLDADGDLETDEVIDSEDDTGELEVIEFPDAAVAVGGAAAASSFGDLWDTADGDESDVADVPDEDTGLIDTQEVVGAGLDSAGFEMTQADYLQTATREHEGLAAAIADADDEDTEQVALAAPIPGLESTVVGFEDVVEAEGLGKARARRGGDLVARVITAVVLIAFLGASLVWRPALLALATVVFVIAAGEFYTALTRTGRHPIGLFGFIGIVGATVGAFFWGAIAIPVSFVLIATMLLLYYAVVPGKREPMANLALTITVMAWVGLGAYAMLIAASDDYRTLIIGVVVAVAAMDIAQYFVGRSLGRHQLAPWVSPKKTVEGLIGGVVVALAIGASLHFFPPFELTSGLALGVAVAVLVPLGDLAVSAAKRSLDLKDMGSILPGHGGFLDRIDGLLFVIPAAWAIFIWAGIL